MIKGKKYYKNLYEIELENRKKLIEQNSKLSKENVDYQMLIKALKERCARLTIDLEDIDGLLQQETEAKEVLLKERTKLRKMVTKLGGNWKEEK